VISRDLNAALFQKFEPALNGSDEVMPLKLIEAAGIAMSFLLRSADSPFVLLDLDGPHTEGTAHNVSRL
jgi:hypothetical protein